MTTSNDEILEQSMKCLSAHLHSEWGDRVPLDVFNRLLAKNIRPNGWTPNMHLTFSLNKFLLGRSSGLLTPLQIYVAATDLPKATISTVR